jgi:uncharacterized protein YjdB
LTLQATVLPEGVVDLLQWSSSNTKVVAVEQGVITAVGGGNATVTVTTSSGKTATCTVTVTVPATGVALDKTAVTLHKGGTLQLSAVLTPADSTDNLTWQSDNEAVVTVDRGVLTGVGVGTANVTVATSSGFTASCKVTVIIPAESVTLDRQQLQLYRGENTRLTATMLPADTTDTLTWSSSNTKVVTVENGVINAVGAGEAVVTVTTSQGKTASCTVTVNVPAAGVTLNQTDVTLKVGETATLTATLTPADSTDTLTWSSGNEKIFTVKDGVITAVAPGTATLTVTAREGVQATCTVRVKSPVPDGVSSQTFTVKNGYIRKIPLGTTVSHLLEGLNEKSYCKVYIGEKEADGKTLAATGMVVKLLDGDTVKASYTLVVTGDADGDGEVTVNDYVAIKGHILKKAALSGAFAEAADADGDGGITVNDYVEVKAHILKKNSITAK